MGVQRDRHLKEAARILFHEADRLIVDLEMENRLLRRVIEQRDETIRGLEEQVQARTTSYEALLP